MSKYPFDLRHTLKFAHFCRLVVNIRQPQKQLKAAKTAKLEKGDRAPGYDWDKNGRIAELKIR